MEYFILLPYLIVGFMGVTRNIYIILVGKPEEDYPKELGVVGEIMLNGISWR
jgi:hypothetical protein